MSTSPIIYVRANSSNSLDQSHPSQTPDHNINNNFNHLKPELTKNSAQDLAKKSQPTAKNKNLCKRFFEQLLHPFKKSRLTHKKVAQSSSDDLTLPPDFKPQENLDRRPLGLYGKPTMPKWFEATSNLLTSQQKKLPRAQKEAMILAIKQEIFTAQKLSPEDLQKLKETWANILNARELPPKDRKKVLKGLILESLQGDEKIYKRLKKQWRRGGAIWGGGLGVPYLLLASGTYLGVIGKAALSVGATAFSALPNGYLEIALETMMGMLYDAEPSIDKGMINAMSYQLIYQRLKEPTLQILLGELKSKHQAMAHMLHEIDQLDQMQQIEQIEQIQQTHQKALPEAKFKNLLHDLQNKLHEKHSLTLPFSYETILDASFDQSMEDGKAEKERLIFENRQSIKDYEAQNEILDAEIEKILNDLKDYLPDGGASIQRLCQEIKSQKTLFKFAQDALMSYILPFYEEYAKQNAQTRSGFCDSSRTVVSGLGLILALSLTLAGVAATLEIPPIGLSAFVLGCTLCARIVASSLDKSRLRKSRIENNIRFADVKKNSSPQMLEKSMHRQFYEVIDPKAQKMNDPALRNHYTADDIDGKKVLGVWKTWSQRDATFIEKSVAHQLSCSQIKIEKAQDACLKIIHEMDIPEEANCDFMTHLTNTPDEALPKSAELAHLFDTPKRSQFNLPTTPESDAYDLSDSSDSSDLPDLAKTMKTVNHFSEILHADELATNSLENIYGQLSQIITSIKKIDILRNHLPTKPAIQLELFQQKDELFKSLIKILAALKTAQTKGTSIHASQHSKVIQSLEKIIAQRTEQLNHLKDFQHFQNKNFLQLNPQGLIYKCLINDKFLLKTSIKARYKMAGIVVSQVMRNIGSSMGTGLLSPLFLNTIGVIAEEGAGNQVLTAPRMAGAAVGTAIWGGMASHDKHSRQDAWISSSLGRKYQRLTRPNSHDQSTLMTLDYAFEDDAGQQILQISIAEIAPTYNKIHSRTDRFKHHLSSAIDVALYMPFRHITTWIQASRQIWRTRETLRANQYLFELPK
jgi:hypothetical protein